MRRTTILNSCQVRRTTFQEAEKEFYKHCVLRNLRDATLRFYKEDLNYFHSKVPVKYMDDLKQEGFDDFIFHELEEGKKVIISNLDRTSLKLVSSSSDLGQIYKIEYNGSRNAEIMYGAVRSSEKHYTSNSGRITISEPDTWYNSTILSLENGETATARLCFNIPTDIENLSEGYTLSFLLPKSDGKKTKFSFFVPVE